MGNMKSVGMVLLLLMQPGFLMANQVLSLGYSKGIKACQTLGPSSVEIIGQCVASDGQCSYSTFENVIPAMCVSGGEFVTLAGEVGLEVADGPRTCKAGICCFFRVYGPAEQIEATPCNPNGTVTTVYGPLFLSTTMTEF
jgi:hypothetical protein